VLCRRLFDGRHAVAASLLLAISPTTIPYSGGLLSEVLTTLVVVGVLLLLAQVYESKNDASVPFPLARIAVAGLILGAGILLRPAVIALAVGMGLYLLMRRSRRLPERVVAAGIFTLAAIAVVTPWSYRNYRVFGAFVPISTNGGYDLYLGNNPQAVGGGWMPLDEGEHRPGDGTGDEVRVDRDAQDRAILWMRQYPLDYAELTIKRSVRWLSAAPDNVAGTRLTSTEEVDEAIFRAYRARAQGVALPESPAVKRSARLNSTVVFVWSLIMIPLALAGIVIDLSRGARWLVLAPLLSYALVLSLAFMQLRFREAVMPLILMYASVGAFGLPSLRQQWAQASPMSKAALVLGIPLFMAFGLQLMRDRGTISSILGGG
jgi:hypothetical protein